MSVINELEHRLSIPIKECSYHQIYTALTDIVNKHILGSNDVETKKKLYYISAEFLIGKLLVSNLINLGIYTEVKDFLERNGFDLDKLEELEYEPSLGNGGLGRLAACFLDSIATLGLCGDGIGLCYHMGLFKQVFKNNHQTEEPNPWISKERFLQDVRTCYKVRFKDFEVTGNLYDIDIIGYKGKRNKLHLFDVTTVDEGIIKNGISYDKTNIPKNLTLFLYPDDSDAEGKYLRLYQQYFMVSCAAQLILEQCVAKGSTLYDLFDYAVIQINDTHPSLIIPELIRLLCERGLYIDDAIEVVTKTCAYTNHTILAEALEKWPLDYIRNTVPQLVPIIEILDNRVRRKYSLSKVNVIDENNIVHMAHMDIHYTFSTNGVASLHTEILKETELSEFYKLYPKKFNNKTNGITFRRWLFQSNPLLCDYLESLLGEDFKTNHTELRKLTSYKGNKEVTKALVDIKHQNKLRLKKYLYDTMGININENTIFDVQIKRLHEYKRQQMNILYYIKKYLDIKAGKKPSYPITAIFGAKAAPAYTIAKDIIHLILCMQALVRSDKEVSKYLNIVMIENYNVTAAQYIIPACDISEQISLASKEASGTGNMKLMLNGAVTLGTEDGANVEIHQLVGDENIYIFGLSSEQVIKRYQDGTYNASEYYKKDKTIAQVVDFITSKDLLTIGDINSLQRLKDELINKDWFMTFPDFEDYIKVKEQAFKDYENRCEWAEKMLVNISQAGYFSSDRTIEDYNRDIWKLNKIK